MCISDRSILFFHENFHFFGWDWGILGSNDLMNWWDITPPFMYCVFHHISDHLQKLILFWQFKKKSWDSVRPPPLVGTKSQVCQRKYFWGFTQCVCKQKQKTHWVTSQTFYNVFIVCVWHSHYVTHNFCWKILIFWVKIAQQT